MMFENDFLVGAIGIKSASVSRGYAFNEAMVEQLGEIRDSFSAVSLDEEMTNLIKFQKAYAAAAKIVRVADEMLVTLLSKRVENVHIASALTPRAALARRLAV